MQIPQWVGYVVIGIIGFILIAYLVISGMLPEAFAKVIGLGQYAP